jgi:16S rRNA (guanine966-N2)-methyltransferase
VDFVESDARLARLLRDNLARLKQSGTVSQSPASRFVESAGGAYDIVFLDPPFGDDLWDRAMSSLETHDRLEPAAWIYVESPRNHPISAPSNWTPHREGHAGAVRFALYRRTGPSATI